MVRVFCGMFKISYREYMVVNTASTIIWIALIGILAHFLDVSVDALKLIILRGEIAFTAFVVVVVIFELWLKKYIKNKFKIF